jgi:hypothetical protein
VLGVAAMVAWGFWPSYFGPLLRGGVDRHWIIHVHAAVFLGWVILLVVRRNPEWHKRLILSATIALAAAAIGRVLPETGWLYTSVWLSPLFASMLVDLATRRRLHPVSLISLPVFLLDAYKVNLLGLSPLSRELGRMLIAPFV